MPQGDQTRVAGHEVDAHRKQSCDQGQGDEPDDEAVKHVRGCDPGRQRGDEENQLDAGRQVKAGE